MDAKELRRYHIDDSGMADHCNTTYVLARDLDNALSAQAAEVERIRDACNGMLYDLDSFEGPEKWIDGDFPHYCPAGRMVDMKHIARIRASLSSASKKEPTP